MRTTFVWIRLKNVSGRVINPENHRCQILLSAQSAAAVAGELRAAGNF
jgi:hypothetical protein